MHHIYAIVNRENGRVYIGQAAFPSARWSQHKQNLKGGTHVNTHLQNAWAKYGEVSFDHFLICSWETREECNEAEKFYIAWYKSIGLAYNLTGGGEGLFNPDASVREKIAAKKRGKKASEATRQKIRDRIARNGHPNKGKKASEETRKRLSESHMGQSRPCAPETRQKMSESISKAWTPERKAAFAESKRGNKNFEGRTHSEEAKQKIADAHKGEKNGMFGKPTSEAQKEACSKRWKGVKRGPMSEETKQKLREARAAQVMAPMSEETKEKIRQKKLERDAAARE